MVGYIEELRDYDPPESEESKTFLAKGRAVQIKQVVEQIVDDEFERLKEHADEYISGVACDRASRFLDAVLAGDPEAGMKLLGDPNDTSRYGNFNDGEPWASMIHGRLFETNGMEVRRKIVEAHADLLTSERMKDLESVVAGLQLQILELQRRNDVLSGSDF